MSIWKKYEKQILKALKDKYRDFHVRPNEKIPGVYSKIKRQVDVSLRKDNKGTPVLGIVECKCYSKRIDVKVVDSFIGFLQDVGADFGFIVTNRGFSPAARRRALGSAIRLDVVKFSDWDSFDAQWFTERADVEGRGEFIIRCTYCNHKNIFIGADLDFEVVESEERAQGNENIYNATWDVNCEKCQRSIHASFDVVEYPVGCRTLGHSEIQGGELLKKFNIC